MRFLKMKVISLRMIVLSWMSVFVVTAAPVFAADGTYVLSYQFSNKHTFTRSAVEPRYHEVVNPEPGPAPLMTATSMGMFGETHHVTELPYPQVPEHSFVRLEQTAAGAVFMVAEKGLEEGVATQQRIPVEFTHGNWDRYLAGEEGTLKATDADRAVTRVATRIQLLSAAQEDHAAMQDDISTQMRAVSPHLRQCQLGEITIHDLHTEGGNVITASLTRLEIDGGMFAWSVHYPFSVVIDFKGILLENIAQGEFADDPAVIAFRRLVLQLESFDVDGPTASRWGATDIVGRLCANLEMVAEVRGRLLQQKGGPVDAQTEADLQTVLSDGALFLSQ